MYVATNDAGEPVGARSADGRTVDLLKYSGNMFRVVQRRRGGERLGEEGQAGAGNLPRPFDDL